MVRSTKSGDVHLLQVPARNVEKYISREEHEQLIAPRLAELYRDVKPVGKRDRPRGLDVHEHRLLESVRRKPACPSSEIYRNAGFANSAGFGIKKRLIKRGYLSEYETNLGRKGRRAMILCLTEKAVKELNLAAGPGRGSFLHKQLQQKLKLVAEGLGFSAVIEESLNGTPEGADIGLAKDGLRIAVEVSVTTKPSHESAHVGRALKAGYGLVILTFLQSEKRDRTEELVKSQYPNEVVERVRFCLANELARVLERI